MISDQSQSINVNSLDTTLALGSSERSETAGRFAASRAETLQQNGNWLIIAGFVITIVGVVLYCTVSFAGDMSADLADVLFRNLATLAFSASVRSSGWLARSCACVAPSRRSSSRKPASTRSADACASDVTAEYVLRNDGRITVINQCRRDDGSTIRAEGVARKVRTDGPNSQLKVRFAPSWLSFVSAVWGNYWVIDLAPDYSYAVVGDPSHDYLWILSRTAVLAADQLTKAREAAAANGFDLARLQSTRQTTP